MTTDIATATNPVYAAPHHHGQEASAYTGLAAVNIFVVIINLILVRTTTSRTRNNKIRHIVATVCSPYNRP